MRFQLTENLVEEGSLFGSSEPPDQEKAILFTVKNKETVYARGYTDDASVLPNIQRVLEREYGPCQIEKSQRKKEISLFG